MLSQGGKRGRGEKSLYKGVVCIIKMASNRLTEVKNYHSSRVEVGEESCLVSKNGAEYQRIPIKYDGEQFFLLKAPKCKSFGVQTTVMDGGYTRRTMPLVFDDEQTEEQVEFARVFEDVARNVFDQLVLRGYPVSKLGKLESCFWLGKILYAGIVESSYDSRRNTRYFVGGKEVGREEVGECIEYDAVAAVLIDSIYVGAKTVSIQVKLFEVSLSLSSKRGRVL